MFWKKTTSLIITTEQRIVFIQWTGRKSTSIKMVARERGSSFDQALVQALELHPSQFGQTWILAEDCWSSCVTLTPDVVRAIPESALEQAIAFELEYDSGLDPFSSRVSYVPVAALGTAGVSADNSKSWLVLQVDNERLETASQLLTRSRGSLAGFALPGPPLNGSSTLNATWRQLDSLTEAELIAWGSEWLAVTTANRGDFPVLRLTNSNWTPATRQRVATLMAVAAMAAAAGHWLVTKMQIQAAHRAIEAELATEEILRQDVDRLTKQTALSNQQLAETAQERAAAQQKLVFLQQQEQAWNASRHSAHHLLSALQSTASDSRCIVQVVYARQELTELKGLAISNDEVLALAVKLEELLTSDGWSVESPKMALTAVGGPVAFTLSLRHTPNQSKPVSVPIVAGGKDGI